MQREWGVHSFTMAEWRDFIRCPRDEKSIATARILLEERPLGRGYTALEGVAPVFICNYIEDTKEAIVTMEWIVKMPPPPPSIALGRGLEILKAWTARHTDGDESAG